MSEKKPARTSTPSHNNFASVEKSNIEGAILFKSLETVPVCLLRLQGAQKSAFR